MKKEFSKMTTPLTQEERQRIYQEERTRMEARVDFQVEAIRRPATTTQIVLAIVAVVFGLWFVWNVYQVY
jgi:hypothetical protein